MKNHRRQHERAVLGASARDVHPRNLDGYKGKWWAKRCVNKAARRLARYDIRMMLNEYENHREPGQPR